MTLIKLNYGPKRGEPQDFPFVIAKELVEAGRAEMVSFNEPPAEEIPAPLGTASVDAGALQTQPEPPVMAAGAAPNVSDVQQRRKPIFSKRR